MNQARDSPRCSDSLGCPDTAVRALTKKADGWVNRRRAPPRVRTVLPGDGWAQLSALPSVRAPESSAVSPFFEASGARSRDDALPVEGLVDLLFRLIAG